MTFQIAVMASRYAAVFPLSELINWVYHTRGQRHEELPHSYQMMLFWAGLRGAVGVALATGITGDNADALRTTILVVVVLTVIVFGGTTARMLEVLGIRVGVEDDDDSDDEDGAWAAHPGGLALTMGPGSRRYAGQNGRGGYGDDYEDNGFLSPVESPYGHSGAHLPPQNQRSMYHSEGARRGASNPPRSGAFRSTSRSGFSTQSDSEEEVEPLPSAEHGGSADASAGGEPLSQPNMVFRDGQWFTALDERYLLPLFSNSVASRRHQAKKLNRKASVYNGEPGSPGLPGLEETLEHEGDEFINDADSESGKGKPSRNFR